MLKEKFLLFSLLALLFACHPKTNVEPDRDVSSVYMNTDRLPSQFFEINIGADTTLNTNGAMQVHIPAGAIESQNKTVKLEIKEAFTVQQIITARLSTLTKDGQMLASNGMFYINVAAGEQAKIVKDISIKTPSSEFNPKVQLYSGEKTADNKILWNEPKNVLKNGDEEAMALGRSLFSNNCASCHKIDRDLTGPALLHVTKRLTRKWLYSFTRNNTLIRASGDCYANALFDKWNHTQMNLFPNLDNTSMKALYDYIDQESNHIASINVTDSIWQMPDCLTNRKKLDSLLEKKNDLIADNGKMTNVTVEDTLTRPIISLGSGGSFIDSPDMVFPENYDAVHYQFNINTFGWYNIDAAVDEGNGIDNALLRVQIKTDPAAQFNIFFLIPSQKIFMEGGKLTDANYYGFKYLDGTLPIPLGANCIVFAIGELNSKLIFGRLNFKATLSQTLQMEMIEMGKADIEKQLLALSSSGFTANIQPAKNFTEINTIDSALNTLKINLKGCNCGSDSTEQRLAPKSASK